ncbi:MAG: HYR domain-containing protein [Saprospiraceae bacterium]|nr:HYR domain-containing protein [Saprospiraceae bacterium]
MLRLSELVNFGTFPTGTHLITYTGIDDCGNSTVCAFTVTVTDQFAPVAACRKMSPLVQMMVYSPTSIIL